MAHLTDLDNVAPAHSLYAMADILNTWRTRIDVLNDALGDITSVTTAGRAILDDADASAQRTTLGLAIGTNVLAYDAGLSNLAGIAMQADRFYYTSADNTHVAGTITAFGRSIIDDADEATFKATVNLEIGTDVQAYDADLSAIVALAKTDGNFIVGNGSVWVAESGATARTSLGLGSMAIQAHTSVNIDGGTIGGIAFDGALTMTLGSDVDGDIYYRASNVLTRLAKGTAAQGLVMNAGGTAPEWATPAGGGIDNVVEDTTPQLGGELDCQAHTIGFTQQTTTGDGTTTIDWKLGNKFYFTFGAQNDTFTFTQPTHECNLLLVLKQDGTGSRLATWPNTVKWPAGTAPTLSTGAAAVDIVSFFWDGTNYHGSSLLNFSVPA